MQCHPERSTTESKANGRAKSKDPYRQQRFWMVGILRLRERIRARYAQDDRLKI